jgi:hypothetical protein
MGAELTLSFAALLVADPAVLLTVTLKWDPSSESIAGEVV